MPVYPNHSGSTIIQEYGLFVSSGLKVLPIDTPLSEVLVSNPEVVEALAQPGGTLDAAVV